MYWRNPDEELRRLEREKDRDSESYSRWIVARVRAGTLPPENVELAAALGSPEAQSVVTVSKNLWIYLDSLPRTKHARLGLAMCYLMLDDYMALQKTLESHGVRPYSHIGELTKLLEAYLTGSDKAKKLLMPLFRELETRVYHQDPLFGLPQSVSAQHAAHIEYASIAHPIAVSMTSKWGSMIPQELMLWNDPKWLTLPCFRITQKHHAPTFRMLNALELMIKMAMPTNSGCSKREVEVVENRIVQELISILLDSELSEVP